MGKITRTAEYNSTVSTQKWANCNSESQGCRTQSYCWQCRKRATLQYWSQHKVTAGDCSTLVLDSFPVDRSRRVPVLRD